MPRCASTPYYTLSQTPPHHTHTYTTLPPAHGVSEEHRAVLCRADVARSALHAPPTCLRYKDVMSVVS